MEYKVGYQSHWYTWNSMDFCFGSLPLYVYTVYITEQEWPYEIYPIICNLEGCLWSMTSNRGRKKEKKFCFRLELKLSISISIFCSMCEKKSQKELGALCCETYCKSYYFCSFGLQMGAVMLDMKLCRRHHWISYVQFYTVLPVGISFLLYLYFVLQFYLSMILIFILEVTAGILAFAFSGQVLWTFQWWHSGRGARTFQYDKVGGGQETFNNDIVGGGQELFNMT